MNAQQVRDEIRNMYEWRDRDRLIFWVDKLIEQLPPNATFSAHMAEAKPVTRREKQQKNDSQASGKGHN